MTYSIRKISDRDFWVYAEGGNLVSSHATLTAAQNAVRRYRRRGHARI